MARGCFQICAAIAGTTIHPDEAWMKQMARNATMEDCGALGNCRYLPHDRDTKLTRSFQASGQVEPLAPAWLRPALDPQKRKFYWQRTSSRAPNGGSIV